MEIRTTILPGQNGTKQLVTAYGDQLVCVRYRYDKQKQNATKPSNSSSTNKTGYPAPSSHPTS